MIVRKDLKDIMDGFNFPNIFKGNGVDILKDKEAITTQLKLLLNSELFEFRYDPGYGSNVPLLRLRVDNQLTRDLLIDAIYDAQIFCPNLRFNRNQVEITKTAPGVLEVSIAATLDLNDYPMQLQILLEEQS